MKRHKNNTPLAAGKSSFDLIEPEKLFAALQIEKDAILLDAACGQGAYALATVLHDLVRDGADQGALREIGRVLKPGGVLAVIEFKKIPGPPGPPVEIRLSPEVLEGLVTPHGFRVMKTAEIKPYNYLTIFQ